MDLNREFEKTARLSFEFGPSNDNPSRTQQQFNQYYDNGQGQGQGQQGDRFGQSPFSRGRLQDQGPSPPVLYPNRSRHNSSLEWTLNSTPDDQQGLKFDHERDDTDEVGGRGPYSGNLERFNYAEYSSQIALPQTQQRSLGIGPNNFSSIFEMAAELVAQKLEAKLAPPAPPQYQLVYPVNMAAMGGVGGSNFAFAGPSATAPPTVLLTGVVIQIQDTFGMISGDVFFLFTTVTGDLPKLGDKVVVEAFPVPGMPFKYNAKRVQLVAQDFTHQNKQQEKDTNLNFGPLPKMPSSLKLNKAKTNKSPNSHSKRKADTGHERHSSRDKSHDKKSNNHHTSQPNNTTASSGPSYNRSGEILSFDLRDEIPVITNTAKKQEQRRLRSPSPKITLTSKPRSRSRSRSPKHKRVDHKVNNSRRRTRSRSPALGVRIRRSRSRSPIRDRNKPSSRSSGSRSRKDSDDVKIVHEVNTTGRPSTKTEDGRKTKRPPRSIASIIRYHISTPPPAEERFVPNPCAKNPVPISLSTIMQNQGVVDGPSVMYLHNPDHNLNLVARDSQRNNLLQKLANQDQSSLDRFINEGKLSEIENQRKALQAQKKALEYEMKKSRQDGSSRSKSTSTKKQAVAETEVRRRDNERKSRGKEGPVKRLEMNEIGRTRSSNDVEWITKDQLHSSARRNEDRDRHRVRISREREHSQSRRQGQGQELQWELPRQRNKISDVERQEEELSEREHEILERMWVIQSQFKKYNN